MPKSNKKVLFIMTGSIACYKATQVISRLVQNQIEVQVVATSSALKFVGAATLEGLSGRPVAHDLYASGRAMDHIHLIRDADLVLVAPASANYINKMANGIADDLASTLFMAHDFKKNFLVAPAMNTSMYFHPATQASLEKLRDYGVQILEAASGVLACGEVGYGKLLDPDLILQEVLRRVPGPVSGRDETSVNLARIPAKKTLTTNFKAPRILITAGGTQEKIDEVRRITNTSSGKTGFEMATTLRELGAHVQLILSSNSPYMAQAQASIRTPVISYTDHKSLDQALQNELQKSYDYVIHAAAVSDYEVAQIQDSSGRALNANHKLSSSSEELNLKLKKTKKIIRYLKSYSTNSKIKLIGFKLTVDASLDEAQTKVIDLMTSAQCDWVVRNDLKNSIPQDYQIFSSLQGLIASPENLEQMTLLLSDLIFQDWQKQQISPEVAHDSLS